MSEQTPVYRTTLLDFIRQHKGLVMVALAVVMVSMMFFGSFDPSNLRIGGGQKVLTGYNTSWNESDASNAAQTLALSRQFPFTSQLSSVLTVIPATPDFSIGDKDSPDQIDHKSYLNFLANRAILREESSRLGIEPSDNEIAQAIRSTFSDQAGNFNEETYRDFVTKRLPDLRLGEKDLKGLFADALRLKKLEWLLTSETSSNPAIETAILENSLSDISINAAVLPREKFAPKSDPTGEQIDAFWKKATPEIEKAIAILTSHIKTGVALTPEQQSFTQSWSPYIQPQQRTVTLALLKPEKLTQLSEASAKGQLAPETETAYEAFNQAWSTIERDNANNWQETLTSQLSSLPGTKFSLENIGPFSLDNAPQPLQDKSDAKSGNTLSLAQSSFAQTLDPASPLSNFTSLSILENGSIALIHINSTQLPSIKSLDDAKPQIISAIREEQTSIALTEAAAKLRAQLAEAVKAGKSFDQVATAAGATVHAYGPFGPTAQSLPEGLPSPFAVYAACASLNPDDISEPVKVANGELIAQLTKRQIVDSPQLPLFSAHHLGQSRRILAMDILFAWFQDKAAAAGIAPAK